MDNSGPKYILFNIFLLNNSLMYREIQSAFKERSGSHDLEIKYMTITRKELV